MSRKRAVYLRVVLVILVSLGAGVASFAEECRRERPNRLPIWSMSGAWRGDTLLLADSFGKRVMNYRRSHGYLGDEDSLLAQMMHLRPLAIAPYGQGWAVQFQDRLVVLDASMRAVLNENFKQTDRQGVGLAKLYSWAAGSEHFYSCSDYLSGVEKWHRGIVRFKADEPWKFVPLKELSHEEMLFCNLGYPMVATLGDTGYALVMSDRPVIEAYSPKAEDGTPLANVDFGNRPDIPPYTTYNEFAMTMRGVEALDAPVAIFGWKNHLYVLRRQPRVEGSTIWRLLKIDPEGTGEIVADVVLPSTSPHLMVIPGKDEWALVEKGRVRRIGDQDVLGIRYLAASSIEALPGGDVCGVASKVR